MVMSHIYVKAVEGITGGRALATVPNHKRLLIVTRVLPCWAYLSGVKTSKYRSLDFAPDLSSYFTLPGTPR